VTTVALHVDRGGYEQNDDLHFLNFGATPVRLNGTARIALSFDCGYRTAPDRSNRRAWEVRIAYYFYSLDDGDHREIIAYHWHPEGHSNVVAPHIHIGRGAMAGRPELSNAHLPTGIISLADVIRVAIVDFNVQPLRQDWQTILSPAASLASGESS